MAEISLKSSVAADSRLSVTTYFSVWEKSTDVSNNTSKMGYSWHIDFTGSLGFSGTTRDQAGIIYLVANGSQYVRQVVALQKGWTASSGQKYSGSGEFTVTHDTDGSKSIDFSIRMADGTDPRGASYKYNDGSTSYSASHNKQQLALTKINRIAKIDSFNVGANIGEAFNVKFTTYVKGYTYKLRLSIPGVTKIETKSYDTSGTNVSFSDDGISTIIKNVKSGAASVSIGAVIETYSGTTKIGESSELKKDMNLAKAPSIGNISYHRTTSKGEADDGGNYVLCEFGYSADYLSGKNTATAKIEYKRIADQTWQTAVSRSFTEDGRISALFEADGDYTYEIRLTVQDRFTIVTQKRSVAGFETIFDFKWNSDTDGFAWGKSVEFKQQFDIPEGWVYSIGGVPIGLSGADTSGFTTLQSRIKQLEDTVAQLQKQINNK